MNTGDIVLHVLIVLDFILNLFYKLKYLQEKVCTGLVYGTEQMHNFTYIKIQKFLVSGINDTNDNYK